MALTMTDPRELIKSSIRDIPDFPKPGIIFKDITTVLSNPEAFQASIDLFEKEFQKYYDQDPPKKFILARFYILHEEYDKAEKQILEIFEKYVYQYTTFILTLFTQ